MLGVLLHHLFLLPLAGVLLPSLLLLLSAAAASQPPVPLPLTTAAYCNPISQQQLHVLLLLLLRWLRLVAAAAAAEAAVPSRKLGKALKLCVYTDNKYNAQRTVYLYLPDTSKQTRTSGSPRNSLNTVFTFEWCPSIHGKTRHHKCLRINN